LGPSREIPTEVKKEALRFFFFVPLPIPNGMEFFSEGTFLFSFSIRTVNDGTEGSPQDGFLGAS